LAIGSQVEVREAGVHAAFAPAASREVEAGCRRVVIEGVAPEVDVGRFAIKRTVGQTVCVEARIFADGHDRLAAVLKYRRASDTRWRELPMHALPNDRWQAEFPIEELVDYHYTLEAWVDQFLTWQQDLRKRVVAGQDVQVELVIGADLLASAARRASADDAAQLAAWADTLRAPWHAGQTELALDARVAELMARYPDRRCGTEYGTELRVSVDRARARFSAWYELFPRSASPQPGRHGTLRDLAQRVAEIAELGFDVLYLPPIHPIGRTKRKGPNNAADAGPEAPGSPWAIGGPEGGHKAIHPALGTLDDFRHLVQTAAAHGVELALDLAFQCSPDHPYVREHPEWFRWRPDGTVQYAENPPKKYEDIYPFNFETEQWRELWAELHSVVMFWIDHGVRIFRVDNPHTKPFRFWEWLIGEVRRKVPEAIFLAEAFTRPRPMHYLAKLGFTQSYTYFAWRNTKRELTEYFTELTQSAAREYFRPNLWPNTPDILPEYLQYGGRPAFIARLVLAATLSGNYGIYGPPFEGYVGQAREPGSEEYLGSEKYEIRHWDPDAPGNLRQVMRRVNRIRRENAALENDRSLCFRAVDNPQILAYTKESEDRANTILVVVNLDPHHTQSGWLELPLEELEIRAEQPYQVHDLLGDGRYLWHGARNYVELNPRISPAQIFRIRRRLRTEEQFEYYV
jgi:starch synthase (maltosyl-transferring)